MKNKDLEKYLRHIHERKKAVEEYKKDYGDIDNEIYSNIDSGDTIIVDMERSYDIEYEEEYYSEINEQINQEEKQYLLSCDNCDLRDKCNPIINKNPKKEIPYYAREEQENCSLRDYLCYIIKCGDEYVADGIKDDFKLDIDDEGNTEWIPKNPIFISARTGKGKNTFIEEHLLPHIREVNCDRPGKDKVLILSNRVALFEQMKNRIEKKLYAKFIEVLTYQQFLIEVEDYRKWQEYDTYSHVICDECHFFTSDAMFNPNTYTILSEIVDIFKNAIRIYMTATPYEVLPYICDRENIDSDGNKSSEWWRKNKRFIFDINKFIHYYQFNRDYSYLNIKYFSNHHHLKDKIVASVKDGEKWLIFIDNKKRCSDLKKELEQYPYLKGKVLTIDSGSKRKKEYNEMIQEEKFSKDTAVLISTSVIDNGVNFKDEALTNIVISTTNKDKCLQMVGRIRVNNKDKITLYLKEFDIEEIEYIISTLEKQREAYRSHGLAYSPDNTKVGTYDRFIFLNKYYNGDIDDFEDAKHWFYRSKINPEIVHPNKIALSLLKTLLDRYNSILNEMKRTGDGREYLKHQLSWFNRAYKLKNDLTRNNEKTFKEKFIELFSDDKIGTIVAINDDEKKAYGKLFCTLYVNAYESRGEDNSSRDKYGMAIINKILAKDEVIKELGKKLYLKSDQKTNYAWVLDYIPENKEK